jgi:hypothetical protein
MDDERQKTQVELVWATESKDEAPTLERRFDLIVTSQLRRFSAFRFWSNARQSELSAVRV